ncbi:sigma-54-dependent Fis family transcriptional regulator [Gynuella sunshinyii]|uniref:Transcriptional regulator containing GAF, AAA-type ATPase, and DNA binding domain n=1 Tax=Gynuella sunshinyii YC6258 TaxID=1445510 RepID=A0A0C5VLY7_9GAMM|nr:sigma-54-dependent Fis family transcriptional regulator [Gynuella sunshinyii]AJQ95722.1 transcriptional regulator containing GAF, AAA-type ATPase, and DNA binding domain [Gynuella sunshinyii YC6258]
MDYPDRISLASMSRQSESAADNKDSRNLNIQQQLQQTPTLDDLTECLSFSPGDGRIWLNDQRMQLIHTSSFGVLRREMIEAFGMQRARGIMTRTGYASGARDAELMRKRWPGAELTSVLIAGTQLHALEGAVQVETLSVDVDTKKGHYEGEFLWHHCTEDEEHVAAYGIGSEPACWWELGYAMGYVSGLVGSLVIFREVECRAMGHSVCRIIGKTAKHWGNIDEDMAYLNASSPQMATETKPDQEIYLPTDPPHEPAMNDVQMIGASAAFTAASHSLKKVAPTQATVLLSGESGVGKELFATMLHRMSSRNHQPFVAFNCAAIPENLIEAELFGVEKGAYTGAIQQRAGRFERADGGTLFLDEIATLSLEGQSKLLRALQEKEIERVGSSKAIKVDVRVVAATNVDLREAVERGEFRGDLFYRLNVFPILLPPLRERRDDLPLLINHFFHHYCRQHGRTLSGITQKATQALLHYDFPGNIRELQNIIERGVIDADDENPVDLHNLFRNEPIPKSVLYSVNSGGALSNTIRNTPEKSEPSFSSLFTGKEPISIDVLEQKILQEAVKTAGGNLAEAARRVGLTRAQLAYRLKKTDKT